jgi:Xaa-Pro aminopeptidase
MNISAIQSALRDRKLDGWLFCDHHRRDPMAYGILGLPGHGIVSRRWFYLLPAEGEPVKLAHRVEPRMLDTLPGRQEHYLAWTELHAKLKAMVAGKKRLAMQYSPDNNIPYIGLVDAGTVELIRSFGPEIVTSADLVQQFEATVGEQGYASHVWAGDRVQKIKDETFDAMGKALRDGTKVTETELRDRILRRFKEEGLTSDDESPIVGFNDHPADPHFEPTKAKDYTLKAGDTILLDLWARRVEPVGIYYDITWCAFAGPSPPAKYREIFDVVRRARDTAFDFVAKKLEAGTPVHGYEVDDACRKVVKDAGYGPNFLHRTGHSIGTHVHGNGANIDNLETKDERPIVPGTCFSIEPGIYLADARMAVRAEIDVFVRGSGKAEIYGAVQKELVLVG